MRAIANDLDKRLVDRTVELAKSTGGFGWKQLRVALDSSPLRGGGRVEDTWNLIGRAMSKVVHAVSLALGVDEDTVIKSAKLSVLTADSIKAALDVDIPAGGTIQGYGVKFYRPGTPLSGQNERSTPVVMQNAGEHISVVWPTNIRTQDPVFPLPKSSTYGT